MSSGLVTYHNNQPFSTYDEDHSGHGCSNSYGNEPWWYVDCWSGAIMGGGEASGGYPEGAYWTGSSNEWGVPDASGANGAGNGWVFVR